MTTTAATAALSPGPFDAPGLGATADDTMTLPVFYLGSHQPHWLWTADFALFVSHHQLARRRNWKRATCRWALDSGGFTELSMHGRWRTSAEDYAVAVTAYCQRIGLMDFAAPQDWMCHP